MRSGWRRDGRWCLDARDLGRRGCFGGLRGGESLERLDLGGARRGTGGRVVSTGRRCTGGQSRRWCTYAGRGGGCWWRRGSCRTCCIARNVRCCGGWPGNRRCGRRSGTCRWRRRCRRSGWHGRAGRRSVASRIGRRGADCRRGYRSRGRWLRHGRGTASRCDSDAGTRQPLLEERDLSAIRPGAAAQGEYEQGGNRQWRGGRAFPRRHLALQH